MLKPETEMGTFCSLLCALALCLFSTVAYAEPAEVCGPGERDPGRLAAEGLRLYQDAVKRNLERSDPQAAVRQFERALRCYRAVTQVSQDPAKIYHPMGLVFQRLGRYTEAFDAFKRFLAEVPEDRRKPGVTKQIADRLRELRQHVAELSIDTVPGLEVRVDDQPLGRSPLPRTVPVAPGSHTVAVGEPERGTLGAEISVKAGEVRRVDLTAWKPRPPAEPARTAPTAQQSPQQMQSPVPEPARPEPAPPPARRGLKPWAIALIVVGAVAVVGAGVGVGVAVSQGQTSGPDLLLRF